MKFSDYAEAADQVSIKGPKRIMIIMRGFTGTGKTFRAKQLLKEYGGGDPFDHILSTDDYFIPKTLEKRRDGEYVSDEEELMEYRSNWSRDVLGKAHSWNEKRYESAIEQSLTPIIVDNTNSRPREMRPYVEKAYKAGYEVLIREPTSDWWKKYYPFMKDKKKNVDKLSEFADILVKKSGHGVPKFTIERMIDRYQTDITIDDVLEKTKNN